MQPKRLLDARGGPSDAGRLLRAAQRDTPAESLRHTTWKALAAQTALVGVALGSSVSVAAKGAGLTAAASSSAGSSLGVGTLLSKTAVIATMKSIILGVGIGGGIAATFAVATRFSEPTAEHRAAPRVFLPPVSGQKTRRPVSMQQTLAPSTPAPSTPAPDTTGGLPTNSTTAKPLDTLNLQGSPAPHKASYADLVRVEAHRVSEARSLVRNGKGAAALRMLAELEVTSPGGLLRQERDALRIDALFLTGRRLEARQHARQFAIHYPDSPLAARWSSQEQHVQ